MLDDRPSGGINRITYEWCVLTALREKVRCKEVWVKGADRFRNPDEDLPEDFDARRQEYYVAIEQPRDAKVFVETLRLRMETALTALNADLPSNSKVSIVTTKRGKGRFSVTPLEEQPEPPNIIKLTRAMVEHWPMTNLLDILKETELRVRFTSPTCSGRLDHAKCLQPMYYSAGCCCACMGWAPMPASSECAAVAARTAMPTCSTSDGAISPRSTCGL